MVKLNSHFKEFFPATWKGRADFFKSNSFKRMSSLVERMRRKEIENKLNGYNIGIIEDDDDIFDIYAGSVINPTDNCQLFSVASANNIIEILDTSNVTLKKEEQAILFIFMIESISLHKNLALLDVNKWIADYLFSIVKALKITPFTLCSQYESTNGSDMSIIIINVQEFKRCCMQFIINKTNHD